MAIDRNVIESVLKDTDMVRLVGEYVQLKRLGRSLKGLCPFHHEKTPSFHVNAERQRCHCFGCGFDGNAIDFLMRIENLKFHEAIEKLAARLGIQITYDTDSSPAAASRYREKKSLLGTMTLAQGFFLSSFLSTQGSECREYAKNRGITDEMIASFALGFAPESWDALVNALKQGGADLNDATKLGLTGKRDSGGYYAKFRNRLMFPVHNSRGEIIAFGGRVLGATDTAKYINSPESEIYTKGENLYGLFQAKTHIIRENNVILVEGNVDVVMMHGFGFRQTIASMGTALTPKQASLIYKSLPESGTKTLYVMYDGDNAGRKAMVRALGILIQYDFTKLLAIELPNGEDPDSFLRTYGADGLKALMDAAQPLAQWCIQKHCREILELAPELRKAGYAELGKTLDLFTNPTVRQHYMNEASRLLGLDIRFLTDAIKAKPLPDAKNDDNARLTEQEGLVRAEAIIKQINPIECEVARLLLLSEKRFTDFMTNQYIDLIQEPALRALILDYANVLDKNNAWDVDQTLTPVQKSLYGCLVCKDSDVEDNEADRWYKGAIATLMKTWAEAEKRKLSLDIAQAVDRNDQTEMKTLIERNKMLTEMLKRASEDRKYLWSDHQI